VQRLESREKGPETVTAPARNRTALLIIDMQEDIVGMRESTRATLPALRRVLDRLPQEGAPRVPHHPDLPPGLVRRGAPAHIEFQDRGPRVIENTPGARIVSQLSPREGEFVVVKKRWSGFFMTELPLLLNRLGVGSWS